MMNKKRLMAILAAGVLTATSFNPAMNKQRRILSVKYTSGI